jgi:CarD family transcriptional regulator
MKASVQVVVPARTAKAASVAVSRVHGDKVADAAAKSAPKPAAKDAPQPADKDTPKQPTPKVAAKPVPKPVATAEVTPPAPAAPEVKPPATATPAVKPLVAKAASAPSATKVGAVLAPTTDAAAPPDDRSEVGPASRQAGSPPPPAASQGHSAGHIGSHSDRRSGPIDRIPPRAPSKAEIFVEGDYVVYPTHGVGKVERIAIEEIAGHRLELIHITFEENRMTLRVPVAKARSAGLRKLATRKLFDEAMAVLKGRARIKRTMWSRRAQEYEAKINSGDPLAIAEVVRDLHRNAGQPDQSFSERQIYEAAMDRLAAELAALDKTDKPTAVTKLGDFLKTA